MLFFCVNHVLAGSPALGKKLQSCRLTRMQTSLDDERELIDRVLPTVVKVHSASCSPNLSLPWLTQPVEEKTGTGFLVGAKEILTTAHVLTHCATISVELPAQSKHNSRRMFPARVVTVAEECDLALISVDDENFWQHVSIRLGLQVSKKIPRPSEEINVVRAAPGGIESGGYVSKAVVNAIDVREYLHGGSSVLTLEIAGPRFLPGVSGSPVVRGAQVVGMIHQRSAEDEFLAHAVPGVIIQKFLEDYEAHGKYKGLYTLPITHQKMENESLRRSMGMNSLETGILITGFRYECAAMRRIACGDVLLEVDGVRIANDGTISLRDEGERVYFDYLAALRPPEYELPLRILRDGGEMEVSVTTSRSERSLPLLATVDRSPPYVIYGGLVFTILTYPYLRQWDEKWPENLLRAERQAAFRLRKAEIVVCSAVLRDKVNLGYDNLEHRVVEKVNNVKVTGIMHLYHLIQKTEGTYVRFLMQDDIVVVFSKEAADESERRVLGQYRIPNATNLPES
uniref:Protease Do-like PDZ domain-containing protein n=1 Tax=Rhodosorus marinus TaxID=101924 RepID=A0A7S2ZMX3_9RHOD|mmetsp:Transcript_24122/g.95031  ORF Transcript_24122/g.95031 Transcript_24122/m.95031 type:complete len:512 (+) Transcript_24122:261-1796(+)